MDLSALIGRIDGLAQAVAGRPWFRWGIITNADPLQVQLDGDSAPIVGAPSTLVGDLQIGDRVRVEQQGARLTVHGKALAQREPTGFETVGVARVPEITHPAGAQRVDLVKTQKLRLTPGIYRVSWPVKYIITRSGETAIDASGAYLYANRHTGETVVLAPWDSGAKAEHWGSYFNGEAYGDSAPEGWLTVEEPAEFEFIGGLHSYLKLKLYAWPSALVIEKFPRALEISISKLN